MGRHKEEIEWIMTGKGDGDQTVRDEMIKMRCYGKSNRTQHRIMHDLSRSKIIHDGMNRMVVVPGLINAKP